jgi:Icc-related predicted phosphoesterase
MDNKLTLKLDQQVIERAKNYARRKNTSLSKLIESYLELLTNPGKNDQDDVTPLVKSLSGVLGKAKIDSKKGYKKHLIKKYSK